MCKQKFRFLKYLLGIVLPMLLMACATPPVKPPQITLSLPASEKPLVQAKLGKIYINTERAMTQRSSHYRREVGAPFNEGFHTLLRSPGLFEDAADDVIDVRAEILSVQDIHSHAWQSASVKAIVKYEFFTKDGTLILAERITSQEGDDSLDWYSRSRNGAINSLADNIAKLARLVQDKLPEFWKVYQKSAGLQREDRYFQVIASKAVVRSLPDAEAGEVAMLPQTEPVHVTGSLPSGWLQISREGRPLGWVHGSLLREDYAKAPSYRPDEPPRVVAPAAPPAAASLTLSSYHALVIGNNDYQNLPKLRTAINDARTMADLLEAKYGFEVKRLLNATRIETLKAIYSYRQTLTSLDNLLIYYAGHGWLDKEADEGYWLPVDAERQDPANWISNSSITSSLRAMKAKHVLVVADSCYSGKLARGISVRLRTSDYYQRISMKKARTVMASGGLEPVADDGGKGNHSVFASALIEALDENQGILDATLLFSKIRRPVMVNADQTPEYSDIRKAGHDGGDFLFVPR